MADQPLKPAFFVTRQNGSMVPLIPMDELPSTVNIRNVSRSLTPHDITGMTSVGTYEARHLQHVVDPSQRHPIHSNFENQYVGSRIGDNGLMTSRYASLTDHGFEHSLTTPHSVSRLPSTNGYPPKAFGIQEQGPSTMPVRQPIAPPSTLILAPTIPHLRVDRYAIPATGPSTPAPLPPWHDPASIPVGSAPGAKEYCSYWLRHGECDYAQQGCLYKHEMPLDKAVLERLGLRDIPRWYREKHGLGSYLAVKGSDAGEGTVKKELMRRDWRGRMQGRKGSVGGTSSGGMGGLAEEFKDVTIGEQARSGHGKMPCGSSLQRSKVQTALQGPVSPVPWMVETEAQKSTRRTIEQLDKWEEDERKRKAYVHAVRDADQTVTMEKAASVKVESNDNSSPSTPSSPDAVFDKPSSVTDTPDTSAGSEDGDNESTIAHTGRTPATPGTNRTPTISTRITSSQSKSRSKSSSSFNSKRQNESTTAKLNRPKSDRSKGKDKASSPTQPHARRRIAIGSISEASVVSEVEGFAKKKQILKRDGTREGDLLESYDHSD